jgi:2-amino-4-hydroxy-6-hydroxymethyldihydropteridine diphosphokinase
MVQAAAVNRAWLLTGGNMGRREENLVKARKSIERECGAILQSSSIYETAAWGNTKQAAFLNQVLAIQTFLSPQQLLKKILTIEKKMGRLREEKYGPRVIDIDILLFNDAILDQPSLKIPHPQLQNRRFVLVPLAEIAAEIVHPVLKKTIADLLALCPDKLVVKKI